MKLVGWAWTGLTWLGRKVARFCEHSNEHCGIHIRTPIFKDQEYTNKCTIINIVFFLQIRH